MVPVTFFSAKNWVTALAIWGSLVLLVVTLFLQIQSPMPMLVKTGIGLFYLLVGGFLLWTWFSTYYRIADDMLYYRCGPIKGNVPIMQIRKIKQNQHLWAGLRPALSLHGLVVMYNRWDEIYISPKEQDKFLRMLKEVNPDIVVE